MSDCHADALQQESLKSSQTDQAKNNDISLRMLMPHFKMDKAYL